MRREKFSFYNQQGAELQGLLELPDESKVRCYAVFAHCFTCGKDIAAASRIARALALRGIAVLRFDFTGLGNSDGDFSNTNFSSNVDDLLSAAQALSDAYEYPQILIGHSLGGAAVLAAAAQLEYIKAVATIAAPATAAHVEHLFAEKKEEIFTQGEADISIGLQQFTIKKQFLEDITRYNSTDALAQLRKAVLVMHSPLDNIVSIDEASKIYQAVKHPKSFVSLNQADHLLSSKADAEYVAQVLCAWLNPYITAAPSREDERKQQPLLAPGEVLITEKNHDFLRGMLTADHALLADEPLKFGGSNLGPTPYDLLLMGLGACTSMTLRMYAKRKKIPLEDVNIRLQHSREHITDCDGCEQEGQKIETITRHIELIGDDLSEEQRQDLLRIADRCPVHKTLESDIHIVSNLCS